MTSKGGTLPARSTGSRIPDGICKNFRVGSCTLGDACKYAHTWDNPSSSGSGTCRRPLLQVVVMFATDQRVYAYARQITQKFLEAGVDVFVHTELSQVGLSDATLPGSQNIRPENLSSVITSSAADFLVVVGDKNMRNDTCQARKGGKLIETPVTDRILSLLDIWGTQTGLRGASTASSGRSAATVDTDKAIRSLTEEQLFERLARVTGISHPHDRLQRLIATANEVADTRRLAKRGVGSLLPPDGTSFSDADHALVAKLTKSQTALVRMHRDLADAADAVRAMPTLSSSASGGATSAPAHLDLGLGRGVEMPADYRPNAVNGGFEATGIISRRDTSGAPLPALLRQRMLDLIETKLEMLQNVGDAIGEAAGPGASALWHAYLAEYHTMLVESKVEPPVHAPAAVGAETRPPLPPGAAIVSNGRPASLVAPAGGKTSGGSVVTNGHLGAPTSPAAVAAAPVSGKTLASAGPRPVGAEPGVADRGWQCGACTLVNKPGTARCAACDNPQGVRAADDTEWTAMGARSAAARKGGKGKGDDAAPTTPGKTGPLAAAAAARPAGSTASPARPTGAAFGSFAAALQGQQGASPAAPSRPIVPGSAPASAPQPAPMPPPVAAPAVRTSSVPMPTPAPAPGSYARIASATSGAPGGAPPIRAPVAPAVYDDAFPSLEVAVGKAETPTIAVRKQSAVSDAPSAGASTPAAAQRPVTAITTAPGAKPAAVTAPAAAVLGGTLEAAPTRTLPPALSGWGSMLPAFGDVASRPAAGGANASVLQALGLVSMETAAAPQQSAPQPASSTSGFNPSFAAFGVMPSLMHNGGGLTASVDRASSAPTSTADAQRLLLPPTASAAANTSGLLPHSHSSATPSDHQQLLAAVAGGILPGFPLLSSPSPFATGSSLLAGGFGIQPGGGLGPLELTPLLGNLGGSFSADPTSLGMSMHTLTQPTATHAHTAPSGWGAPLLHAPPTSTGIPFGMDSASSAWAASMHAHTAHTHTQRHPVTSGAVSSSFNPLAPSASWAPLAPQPAASSGLAWPLVPQMDTSMMPAHMAAFLASMNTQQQHVAQQQASFGVPPGFAPAPAAPAPSVHMPTPAAAVHAEKPCRLCGRESTLTCDMCNMEPPYVHTFYCSTAHQVADFKEHQKYHEECRRKYKYGGAQ